MTDVHTFYPEKSLRVRGESKYVVHWWGLHQYYMNSVEAEELIDTFSYVGDAATMSAVLGFAKGNVGKYVGMASTLVGLSSLMFRTQVENAAAPGNGIIMNCLVDKVGHSIYYTSQ